MTSCRVRRESWPYTHNVSTFVLTLSTPHHVTVRSSHDARALVPQRHGPLSPKTSQLQIRVSPDQKDTLKSLADARGLSVSAYVLSKALPSEKLDFERRVAALEAAGNRVATLSALSTYLAGLSEEQLHEAVAGSRPARLSELLQNYVAAAVEREAVRRRLEPPDWTARVDPLPRPHFSQDLRSLRPHLMRVTPPAYKRRRVFLAAASSLPARDRLSAGGRAFAPRPDPSESDLHFELLDAALAEERIQAELCMVGGAVMRLVFRADPRTRRPRAMFASIEGVDRAARQVADRVGLPSEWLNSAVRAYVGTSGDPAGAVYDGANLRAFAAPPDYVLAMACACLRFAPAPFTENDIRYLLRFLEIRSAPDAIRSIDDYLNPRQRPADLEVRLERLLA